MNKKLLTFSLLIASSFIFSGCALTSEKKVEILNKAEEKINQLQDKIQEKKQEVSDEELRKEIEKDTDFSLDQNFSEMESILK